LESLTTTLIDLSIQYFQFQVIAALYFLLEHNNVISATYSKAQNNYLDRDKGTALLGYLNLAAYIH
jgi:hypothetical protein